MTSKSLTVLVVDDEAALREALSLRIEDWGYRVRTASDVEEAERKIDEERPDMVLTDVVMPGSSGLDLLRRLRRRDAELPVIVMTAHGSIDVAVDAMKEGALDFLTKPLSNETLRALLDATAADLRRRRETRAIEAKLERGAGLGQIVGQSRPLRAVYRLIELLASSDASAIITGESGTGRGRAARMGHALGDRRRGPFIGVHAAAIPEGLIESEVFGHEKGAFTGATAARPGCFELADGGTLFLDEIAEMPLALQPKLLRILEEGRARRLGGSKEIRFDVREIG